MQLRNTSTRYGWVSIVIHWSVALVVFGLFALGLWMVGLDYYSLWRKDAPDLHKSIGITLFAVMLVRIVWRLLSPPPPALASYSRMTRIGAAFGHAFLYVGLFAVMIAGYLISTADGVGIPVFGLFEIPAVVSGYRTRQITPAWCICTWPGCWWSSPACTAWLR
jgi:cytochrome b561